MTKRFAQNYAIYVIETFYWKSRNLAYVIQTIWKYRRKTSTKQAVDILFAIFHPNQELIPRSLINFTWFYQILTRKIVPTRFVDISG